MKVLIADNERYRDFLQDIVKQNQDSQVSGIAVDADGSPECIIARELRCILDGCPICRGDFRDHTYSVLATFVMDERVDGVTRLAQFLECIRDCRWHDVLGLRQWTASADAIVTFAFRCANGRVGIVTVFSPADAERLTSLCISRYFLWKKARNFWRSLSQDTGCISVRRFISYIKMPPQLFAALGSPAKR